MTDQSPKPEASKKAAPRISTWARSTTAVIFAVAGVAWIFTHPDQFWEGAMLAFVGAGVVGPDIIEGARRLGR